MTPDYRHLHPAYQGFAHLDDDARIEWIRSDRYLAYKRADRALQRLNDILTYPQRDRMPCLLLYGAPGMGKTKILKKFLRDHPQIIHEGVGTRKVPIVSFQMPTLPDEKAIYEEMIVAVGAPHNTNSNNLSLEGTRNLARRLMRDLSVNMLMIDEVHAALAGTARQQRLFLNTIRYLTNDLRIPIVCAGTEEARMALIADQQLADRFEALELTRWRNDAEFRDLLIGFMAILPLREPSTLDTPQVRKRIMDMTDGVTVRIFRLIETLATEAIRGGKERIDIASFDDEMVPLPLVSMSSGRSRRGGI